MMKQSVVPVLLAFLVSLPFLACGGEGDPGQDPGADAVSEGGEVLPEEIPNPPAGRPLQEGFIRARHILVSWEGCGIRGVTRSTEDASLLIGEIQEQLASGEATFEELAFRQSDCTSASDSGMLPDFSRGAMVQDFEDAAFALEIGEVSGVVETDFGFHLIQREI